MFYPRKTSATSTGVTHDWNSTGSFEYVVRQLNGKDSVICGHSDCGSLKALHADMIGNAYIPRCESIMPVKPRFGSMHRCQRGHTTPEMEAERKKEIEIENAHLQMQHLRTYPLVTDAEKSRALEVYGLHCDL